MAEVIALGGKHKSASSLLSQAMADETVRQVVIVTFHENGDAEISQFDCSKYQLAYAASFISNFVFNH